MNNYLHYKGYVGVVEFSEEDGVFHGKVLGIQPLISFEGDTVDSITEDFHSSVNEYILFCKSKGIRPEKTHMNTISIKLGPALYHKASLYAQKRGIKLTTFVEDVIRQTISATAL
jgi:predicted HicB family RNase H-like nuclease